MPVAQLTAYVEYPGREQIDTFYNESERLVRFLVATSPAGFRGFLDAMAQGEPFDTALSRNYAGRFVDVATLDKEFYPYASKDAVDSGLTP
jgi:hypothetical protein